MGEWGKVLVTILYCLQSVVVTTVIMQLLTPKKSRLFTFGIFTLVNVLCIAWKLYGTSEQYVGAVIGVGSLMAYILFFFKERMGKKIFIFISILLLIFLSEGVSLVVGTALVGSLTGTIESATIKWEVILLVLFNLILSTLFLITWVIVWKQSIIKREPLKLVSFLVFPISQFIIIFTLNVASFSNELRIGVIIGIVVGFLADILLIVQIGNQAKKEELEKQLAQMEYLHKLEEKEYEQIQQRQEQMSKVRHDITNQLIVMKHLIAEKQEHNASEMLQCLQDHLIKFSEKSYCQNPVVNAVLEEKVQECNRKNIKLEVKLEMGKLESISKLHVCSIFSNLLDNAIKGVDSIGESDRWIRLTARKKGDYIIIKTQNPTKSSNRGEKPKNGHGYGLLILQEIASNYHGQQSSEFQDGIYTSSITIVES